MRITFKRGVHPLGRKNHCADLPLKRFPCPDRLYVSLSQHIGAPARAVVEVGARVLAGQLIGEASGFVSANIFSPVSGTVFAIQKRVLANGMLAEHIVIDNDNMYNKTTLPVLNNPDAFQIKQRVKDAGIVGMGGATFPTHVKLATKDPIDSLIINASECEPYITCDYRLCLENSKQIFQGIEYLMTALGVNKAYIGIEDNKPDAVVALRMYESERIAVVPLKTKYPQGAEKQLIYSVLRRTVRLGALPSSVGVVVDNVQTAYAVWDAVANGNPLYTRAMTVSGLGAAAGNYVVHTGVLYSDIFNYCQCGADVKKVISGGPMMGFAQADLQAAVTKGTSSVLFLTEKEINESAISQCINCARCAKACPMHLMPMSIDRAVMRESVEELKQLNVPNCMECGCCTFICPAKRPLVTSIKRAKIMLKNDALRKKTVVGTEVKK